MPEVSLDPLVRDLASRPPPFGDSQHGARCSLCGLIAPIVGWLPAPFAVTLSDGTRAVALQVFSVEPSAHAEACPWRRAVEAVAAEWKCPGHDIDYSKRHSPVPVSGFVVHSNRQTCEGYQAGVAEAP